MIHAAPMTLESQGRDVTSADASSATPLKMSAAATSNASTEADRNGCANNQMPTTTQAAPSASTTFQDADRVVHVFAADDDRIKKDSRSS